MKSMATRWMIAAAALAAIAGTAAAQPYTAEIPLSFRVGGKIMQPGAYRIHMRGNADSAALTIYNLDTKTGEGLVAMRSGHEDKAWREGAPVLVFECAGGDCLLREMWTGNEGRAFVFPRPRGRSGEARIEVIKLTAGKAD